MFKISSQGGMSEPPVPPLSSSMPAEYSRANYTPPPHLRALQSGLVGFSSNLTELFPYAIINGTSFVNVRVEST